ncbi:MAG: preprotein translocase subunit SecE, partial [Lysobacterales bacterium]
RRLGVRFPPGLPATGLTGKSDSLIMTTKVETNKPQFINTLLLVAAVALLLGGTAGYYYFQNMVNTPIRVVGLIAVAVTASFVAAQSESGSAFFRFLKESDIERRKVVWPTHQETLQTALMVIVVVILISLLLAGIDWVLGAAVRSLLGGA